MKLMGAVDETTPCRKALRPILLLLQCIGVDIEGNYNRVTKVISVAVTLLLAVSQLHFLSINVQRIDVMESSTQLSSYAVALVNVWFSISGIHIATVLLTVRKMPTVWCLLHQLEQLADRDHDFHKRLHTHACIAVTVSVFYVTIPPIILF